MKLLALGIASFLQAGATSQPQASDGPFQALILTVPDVKKFDSEWSVQTEGANVTTTDRLVRNTPTYVVVLYGGCTKDQLGSCRIDVRFRVTDPLGSIYGGLDGRKETPLTVASPARSDSFYLTQPVLGIRIEDREALGSYRITAIVSDLVAKRQVEVNRTVEAVEAE